MDGRLFLACLAFLVVVQVQSYTLRDALRDRELNRLREFDMYDSNRISDEEKLRALNRLREFHLRRMFDEEKDKDKDKDKEGCKDEHSDCHFIGENHCKEQKDEHIKGFIEKHCRKTCNVNNCNGNAEIKPPSPNKPSCINELPGPECSIYASRGLCNVEGIIRGYLRKYCSLSCVDECRMGLNY